jgi:hypothetical protein
MRRTPAATPESLEHGDEPDIAGAPHMRAAAQFHRPANGVAGRIAHRHDAHFVAILLAEQRAGPGFLGLLDAHQARLDRRILQHDVVGDSSTCASSCDVIGLVWTKSKRSRSALTSEPRCAT